MDRDNRANNNGFFHHLLDPHLGEAIGNLVRGLLPQHQPQPQPTDQPPESSDPQDLSDFPPPEPAIRISHSGTAGVGAASGSGTGTSVGSIPIPSSSNTPLPAFHTTTNMSSPQSNDVHSPVVHEDTTIYEDNHDVDMVSNLEPGPSQPSQTTPNSDARSIRRARVEDDNEDEDDLRLRASNRQRRHSRTLHDDEHRFMPIPEDHGVPHSARDARAPPQANAAAAPQPPQQGPPPPPQLNGMTWTFDFIPIRAPRPGTNAQVPEGGQPATDQADHQHHRQHGQHQHGQGWNFFINFQNPGEGLAPQPGAGGNQGSYNPIFVSSHYFYPPYTDGGNQPGPGFALPPFVFPFGMDFLEQRDDPERAQRLVKGLEEVSAGLVKRMERAGGPGTGRGQVPTCAICWESLLEPEGGGFEGNAELARAEAAEAVEAAREAAASQQGRESPVNVDDTTPTMESSAGSSSSSQPSQTEEAPSSAPADGDMQHPKIVVLPCAHAFHATCLLPWFSKPGRTTCPSCRFDIDPDSLTYKPPPLRPLRAHPRPQPTPAPAAGPQPEGAPAGPAPAAPHPPIFFGPLPPPPPFFHFPAAPQPPSAPAPLAEAHNAPNPPHAAPAANQDPHPQQVQNETGQQRQPLPPFVTFDISMIIPIYPGRNGGPAPANNGNGAQAPRAAPADPQGPRLAAPPPPPPPRTDNNGFRLDDTLLQEAVRTTFERLLGRPLPPFVPHPPPPGAAAPGGNNNNNNNNNGQPQWFTFSTGPLPPGFPPMPPLNMNMNMPPPAGAGGATRHRSNPRRPVEKRPWAPPPAPGPTLRQVVERNEREMGLRCSDVSCGQGPSDDEPEPTSSVDPSAVHQIAISALKPDGDGGGGKAVCEHIFHPACLVSAERVAGWGQEVSEELGAEDNDVEVSCPVCRAHGVISRGEWEDGACALA